MNALVAASAFALAIAGPESGHDHGPKLGKVTFESTCTAMAKPLVERGLGWLHSFEYEEAARTFNEVAAADPTCAIAHWGVAMSYYHSLWAPPTPVELERGRAELEKAKMAGGGSKREQDYVAALEIFYRDSNRLSHKDRSLAYSAAMGQAHKRYPADPEAAVFYALSLIAAGTMDSDPEFAKEKQAAEILNIMLAENPEHPGVAHYLIHSFDYPSLAELALPAARRYATLAPASAHAQHMPSHIFTRLGLWDEAIRSNRAAEAAAIAYAKSKTMPGSWDERLHAMDYLAYAFLQTGQDADAQRVLDELGAIKRVDPPNFKVAYAATVIPARVLLERRQWKESAAFELPEGIAVLTQLAKFKWAEANAHFVRAIGAARGGDVAPARAEVAKLQAIEQAIIVPPGEYDWRKQVSIQRQVAEGWLGFAEGKREDALRMMRAVAELDDATEKHPVTPGSILPAREQLGELLLELGRPGEALVAYEESLKRAPRRLAGLYGAARSAKLSANPAAAKRHFDELAEATRNGDASRAEIKEARAFATEVAGR